MFHRVSPSLNILHPKRIKKEWDTSHSLLFDHLSIRDLLLKLPNGPRDPIGDLEEEEGHESEPNDIEK